MSPEHVHSNVEAILAFETAMLTVVSEVKFESKVAGIEYLLRDTLMDIVGNDDVLDGWYRQQYWEAAKTLVKGWCN